MINELKGVKIEDGLSS